LESVWKAYRFRRACLDSIRPVDGLKWYLDHGQRSPMHGAYGLGLIVMVAPALSMVEIGGIAEDDRTYWITGIVSFIGIF
jgi:hypothetical protein